MMAESYTIETEHDNGAWHQWFGGRDINLTMLESTVSMIEMLPEEDLAFVNGMTKRLLTRPAEQSLYKDMTEEEWCQKLDHSIAQAENGKKRDAHMISDELRNKYSKVGKAI